MPDTSKSRLGKYELLEEIGDGAEGRIFRACCVEAGVPGVAVGEMVALKRLRQTGNETQSDIFKRTTRILRNLDHPNIVRYKDSFEGTDEALDEPVYCLVTELLEGETLKELMDKNKSGLPWDRAQKILMQTLQALEYAGNHSVIHRDLKPSNIYLTHQGDVKIIDFGIAKHEDSGATTTSSGGLLGSWDYMACDFVLMSQESNFRGDQQSDIFSFGVCFYQLLTGSLPYPPLGGNAQIAYFQRYMSPEKLPKVKFTHPIFSVLRGARACVEKCLTFDRATRYKTFTEALTAARLIQRRTLQHGDEEQYEYLEYIGKGGFGKVYRARRMRDGLEVAIKEVMADRNASRFVREAKMLKVTQHPHLVQYLDFVEVSERGMGEERRLFLVLEYLPGMPQAGLSHRIKIAPNGLDPVEVLRFFSAFLDCLEYLHQNTIIHRDIKPGNLYAPAKAPEQARIFDLGIAHDTDGTKTHGQVPGTLDYMPAEFATQGGERGSAQSDIYSMGVTLYQALTGKLPFERLPDDEKMAWTNWYMRCEKPPELPFTHAVFSAHPELEKLLRSALALRPQDRFASAKAMRLEIETILENWDHVIRIEGYEKALADTRAAFARQDYPEAARLVRTALEVWPEGAEARELLDKIETEKLRRIQYDTALTAAKKELERNSPDAAARQIRLALEIWPEGTEAKQLLDRIERERQGRSQYTAAIAAARRELERDDLDAATRQVRLALDAWPEGGEAKQLLERIETERKRRIQYDTAIAAASEFLTKGELDDASSKAQLALDAWPEKAEARQLLDKIETERLRRIQYDTAVLAAKQEMERDDFDAATRQVRLALGVWPEGVEAKQLLEGIETERQRRIQYDAATTAARKELERDNLDAAIQKAQSALEIWPEKAEGKQLLDRLETERQRRIKYDTAITAARETMERGDIDEAIRRAQTALEVWPEKVEAKRLLDRIETEKRRKIKYDTAIAAAKKALEQLEYETAQSEIEEALKLRPMDATALELRSLTEKGIRELVEDEPKTVATYLEPPPVAEPQTAPLILEPPPVAEVLTAGEVLEPPPKTKPMTSLPAPAPHVPEPPPAKPLPDVKVEAEAVREPISATPQPAPIKPEPVLEPKKPSEPEPPRSLPSKPPERRKKSKALLLLPIAACVIVAVAFIFRGHNKPVEKQGQQQEAEAQRQKQEAEQQQRPQQIAGGGVFIQSDPSGADVWLGNQPKGKTPLHLPLPAGQANVTLKVPGLNDQVATTTVAAGKTNDMVVNFPYGSVVIRSEPAGAAVEQNGTVFGYTPYTFNRLAPGRFNFRLSASGWQSTNVPAEVSDHQTTSLTVKLQKEKGVLQLTGNLAGITAKIDGVGVGPLPAGFLVDADVEHTVTAEYKGSEKTMRAVSVKASQTNVVPFVFNIEAPTRWTNSIGMTFAWITNLPGCGNSRWSADRVAGGWVGQHEVTQKEFTDASGSNPSANNQGGNFPVEGMSFEQAVRFCDELTRREGQLLPPGWHYSLPSNAQWEFFAEGTPVNTTYAYYGSSRPKPTAPQAVGQLKANSFGLYDVMGNVFQLTTDHWKDATGANDLNYNICRGGAYRSVSTTLEVHQELPGNKFLQFSGPRTDVGFRVIVVPR
jgi:serine/threonine protein kinase/formylglycine-generating enzyme required for sulfatase activity